MPARMSTASITSQTWVGGWDHGSCFRRSASHEAVVAAGSSIRQPPGLWSCGAPFAPASVTRTGTKVSRGSGGRALFLALLSQRLKALTCSL